MKNKFIIDNDCVKITLHRREEPDLITIIDLDDFERINSYPGSFYAMYEPDMNDFYVRISLYFANETPRRKTGYLSRIIMNCYDTKLDVDHINGITLDNRKKNLRIIKRKNNTTNRRGPNPNNKSGYRNVCQIGNKWVVQLQINGKNTRLKSFPLDQLEEAGAYAEEMRQIYYKGFLREKS